MEPLNVLVQVQSVACHKPADRFGASEPYLWTLFFKLDGDTAAVDDSLTLQGTATVLAPPATRGNLGERGAQMRAGDVAPVPAPVGEYRSVLLPIPLTTPFLEHTHIAGGIGCMLVLLEQDFSREQEVVLAHAALANAVQAALNNLIPTLNCSTREIKEENSLAIQQRVRTQVERAVRGAGELWDQHDSWRNDDDLIGSAVWYCSAGELVAAGPAGRSFTQQLKTAGEWTVAGRIGAD